MRTTLHFASLLVLLFVALWVSPAYLHGQYPPGKIQVVHTFTGGADGANPATGLIQLPNGNFAGMTAGVGNQPNHSVTVYTMTPSGTATTLYTGAADGSQGNTPVGLTQASDGNFYGITSGGGKGGLGTIFQLTPSGVFRLLYDLAEAPFESPFGNLIEANDGNLYGVSQVGGASGQGAVFRVDLRTLKTSLFYSFTIASGLGEPSTGISLGPDGRFYGTTYSCLINGTVFEGCLYAIDLSANASIVAPYMTEDGTPYYPPAFGNDGFAYLAGNLGGQNAAGSIFRIPLSGGTAPELLYSFSGAGEDRTPESLISASDGSFYGTDGMFAGPPSIFQFNPTTGAFAQYTSPAGTGLYTQGILLQSASGSFRGTSQKDGADNDGVSFVLNLNLPKPLPSIAGFAPSSGTPGTVITVWGANYVGLTGIALNGTPAQGQAKSTGFIRLIVPELAASGPISVTTTAGSVVSGGTFTVE